MQRLEQSHARKKSGILVPYHEDKLFENTQIPGRLVSGVTSADDMHGHPWSEQIETLTSAGITSWQATRGLHAGPKWYKELARGDKCIVDTDRKKSFPNAVYDRHPELDAVEMWCKYPENFAAGCGFDVSLPAQYKLVKDFCNSAAGSVTAPRMCGGGSRSGLGDLVYFPFKDYPSLIQVVVWTSKRHGSNLQASHRFQNS